MWLAHEFALCGKVHDRFCHCFIITHCEHVLLLQAGASSMWASCCGLLNEVMGTGAVRTQQPGFGAGAGPFRFAPSAGYSTYPPSSTTSGSAGLACKACGLAFSVFRRKVGYLGFMKYDLWLCINNVDLSCLSLACLISWQTKGQKWWKVEAFTFPQSISVLKSYQHIHTCLQTLRCPDGVMHLQMLTAAHICTDLMDRPDINPECNALIEQLIHQQGGIW